MKTSYEKLLDEMMKYVPDDEIDNIIKNIKFDNGKVTVYRGVNKYNSKNGCSYTLDEEKAFIKMND